MDDDTILTTGKIALDAAKKIVAKLDAGPPGPWPWNPVNDVQILVEEAVCRAKAEILRLVKESLGDWDWGGGD